MNVEYLKTKLEQYCEQTLNHSSGKAYICPLCKSGTGKHKTGAFFLLPDKLHWKCHSCGRYGDLFDLIAMIDGTDLSEATRKAARIFGEPSKDRSLSAFYRQAHSDLSLTDYPQKRGISRAVCDRFNLGYVAEWRHPKVKTAPVSPRLIIPISPDNYTARDTRSVLSEEEARFKKQKVKIRDGVSWIFNAEALSGNRAVFVCEGEFDALSIIEAGGEACATGSTANIKSFLELKPHCPIIVAMDNDEAGEKAAQELMTGLDVPCYRFVYPGKDPNEALLADREAFKQAVADAIHEAETTAVEERREAYSRNSAAAHLQSFMDGIADSANTPATPSGFALLDNALDGGLYEGLYIVGSVTSAGKTSFILQAADQIAQRGGDVLIFSLEMARTELMAKSISRETLLLDTDCARTTRGILAGAKYQYYTDREKAVIRQAVERYAGYADHIYIVEGCGDVGTSVIRATVEEHILVTGRRPTVFVDYIQLLQPYSDRATDKQAVDHNVLELKRISRDYKIPLIGVSSFNRTNYNATVSEAAFKESGAIEYSSDVLFGIQLEGTGTDDFNAVEAKQRNPRAVELIVLKNRNGRIGDKITFDFYAAHNYYREREINGT